MILLNFCWMVNLAMCICEFLTKFLVIWHPWHPWVCICSDLKPLETDIKDSSYCEIYILELYNNNYTSKKCLLLSFYQKNLAFNNLQQFYSLKDQRNKIETFLSESNAGRQFHTQSLFTFQGLSVGEDCRIYKAVSFR